MNKFCFLIFLFPVLVTAQENYDWYKVEQVTFYDVTNINCRIANMNEIPKEVRGITYKSKKLEKLLPTLKNNERDVAYENKCYVLVIKFKNGTIVPFQYLNDQKVLFDARDDHFISLSFPHNTHKKIDEIVKLSLDCLNDPNCSQVK